jgi:hypothetical protein
MGRTRAAGQARALPIHRHRPYNPGMTMQRIPRFLAAAALAATLAGCRDRVHDAPKSQPVAQAPVPADTTAARQARRRAEVLRRQQTMPRFEDYPARGTFTGPPAPVDLASAAGARRFRSALAEGARKGPNFAGRYTYVQWGCGSPCQSFAIIDARTGRVTFGPHSLSVGAAYRLDSELLIANPPEHWLESYGADAVDAVGGSASSLYYRWDGRRPVPLDSLAIGHDAHW